METGRFCYVMLTFGTNSVASLNPQSVALPTQNTTLAILRATLFLFENLACKTAGFCLLQLLIMDLARFRLKHPTKRSPLLSGHPTSFQGNEPLSFIR